MAENKPGETVAAEYEQIDANGQRIAHARVEWYGFDRETANAASNQLIGAVFATADRPWKEVKRGA